jgi:hypothetical protein
MGSAFRVWAGLGAVNKVMTAFGTTNSTIYDGTTSKGAITGKANAITETSISSVATLVISSNDGSAWYYQDGGALTEITASDFPGNAGLTPVGTFAHLDGYAFIMESTGTIWHSGLNTVTAWGTQTYIKANAIPDIGVGIIRYRNYIIGFCKAHFEVFRNAGNPSGSVLSRIEELTQKIGCVHADAITSIRDAVYWAGSTVQGNIGIYSLDGQVKKISPPEIDQQLVLAGPSNITMTSAGAHGRHLVIVRASNTTFVYCVEENNWHEWNSSTPLWAKSSGVSNGTTMVTYFVSDISTSGKVYVFNPASMTFQDDGVSFTASVQTPRVDHGSRKNKFTSRLDIVADIENATSTLGIAYSDDDYVTTSTVRNVDLSTTRPGITRCGRYRRRSYILTHSSNTPMGLEAVEETYEEGTT